MKHLLFFAFLGILISSNNLLAQEAGQEDNSLSNQFDELKSRSNNYQIYKVVEEARLDAFWKSVKDTLQSNRAEISNLRSRTSSLEADLAELQTSLAERDSSLSALQHRIAHMKFLGLDMTKSSYKTFTWILIFVLIGAGLLLFYRYQKANKVTRQTKKEFEDLQQEFEEHRKQTRERETKLKRELQTEINRVEEMKGKLGEE